jgi:hypothetical protein
MAKIRLAGNQYVARRDGTSGTWGSALKMRAEDALAYAADLRAKGIQAEAIQDTGGESLEQPTAASAQTQYASVTWRGVTPKVATNGVYVHAFRAPGGDGAVQTISAKSPAEVIQKLQELAGWDEESKTFDKFAGHPVFTAYVKSLPEEPGTPSAPALQTTSLNRDINDGRILRPGSSRMSALPDRPVAAPIVREDFAAWERTATAAQYRERCKNDAAFLEWANQVS